MILQAIHVDKEFGVKGIKGRIIIKSQDTDVLILYVHYFPSMLHTHELYFQTDTITCTQDLRRYIHFHKICKSLSFAISNILPAAHILHDAIQRRPCLGSVSAQFLVLKYNPCRRFLRFVKLF